MPKIPEPLNGNLDEVFKRFSEYLQEIDRILHLSSEGIAQTSKRVKVIEALGEWERAAGKFNSEKHEIAMRDAKEKAAFATQEMSKGFPVLHMHAIVALWTGTETLTRDLFKVWIKFNPALLGRPPLNKIKISAFHFQNLSEDERMDLIVHEMDQYVGPEHRQPIDKYEAILKLFGFKSSLAKSIRRDLLELYHVRNVFVHRRGVVDYRFVDLCPWVKKRPGEVLQMTHKSYVRYMHACNYYFVHILNLILKHHGRHQIPYPKGIVEGTGSKPAEMVRA